MLPHRLAEKDGVGGGCWQCLEKCDVYLTSEWPSQEFALVEGLNQDLKVGQWIRHEHFCTICEINALSSYLKLFMQKKKCFQVLTPI